MTTYEPIDCSLHDELDSGEEIRLDRLQAVDGVVFGDAGGC